MLCVAGVKVCIVSRCVFCVAGIKVYVVCARYQGVCFVWQVSRCVLCGMYQGVCSVWQVPRCMLCVPRCVPRCVLCVAGISSSIAKTLAGGSFISKVLLANADALCAAASPLLEQDIPL